MNKQEDKQAESNKIGRHYDFDYHSAKTNRFAEGLQNEQIMVVLDAGVAAVVPTSEAVNSALRAIASALEHLPMPSRANVPT